MFYLYRVSTSTASRQAGTINFCQLEESINKWTLELEEQEKVFVNQATQINAWDKLLIANGERIVTLNEEVERVKLEQQQLEHELDYVVRTQCYVHLFYLKNYSTVRKLIVIKDIFKVSPKIFFDKQIIAVFLLLGKYLFFPIMG